VAKMAVGTFEKSVDEEKEEEESIECRGKKKCVPAVLF
jgi:hypothetical protein